MEKKALRLHCFFFNYKPEKTVFFQFQILLTYCKQTFLCAENNEQVAHVVIHYTGILQRNTQKKIGYKKVKRYKGKEKLGSDDLNL